jgi:hypothetical protein
MTFGSVTAESLPRGTRHPPDRALMVEIMHSSGQGVQYAHKLCDTSRPSP